MTKQSLWLQGLLWAEEYVKRPSFEGDDIQGVRCLWWYRSDKDSGTGYIDHPEFKKGVNDYIQHIYHTEHKLQLDKAKQDVQNGNTMNVDEFLEGL